MQQLQAKRRGSFNHTGTSTLGIPTKGKIGIQSRHTRRIPGQHTHRHTTTFLKQIPADKPMPTTVAINGFGRMGRLSLRVLYDRFPDLKVVQINEHKGTAECSAHLLKYDSVHGIWGKDVNNTDDTIVVEGDSIPFSSSPDLPGLKWNALSIDIVLECTGSYRTPETLQVRAFQYIAFHYSVTCVHEHCCP